MSVHNSSDPSNVFGETVFCDITWPPWGTESKEQNVTTFIIEPPTAVRCDGCGATTRYTYARPSTSRKPTSRYSYIPGCGLTKEEQTNPNHGLEEWQYTDCDGSLYDAAKVLHQTELVRAGNGIDQLKADEKSDGFSVMIHKRALKMKEDEKLTRYIAEQDRIEKQLS
jgi:hypothetical protein